MKITLAFFMACTLLAETKTETELRKKLAETQAALSAEQARTKALQTGTQKLTEAVADVTEASQDNARKIGAVADRIIASEASGKRLVETVKSQADATQKETKKLADAVTTQSTTITHAITAQTRQQEQALVAAREVAKNLKEANKVLAKKAEEDRIAKEETAAKLEQVNKNLQDLKYKADIAAAEDRRSTRKELISALAPVLLALVIVLQLLAAGWAKATHKVFNGRSDKTEARIKEIENKINGDPGDGHPSM